MSSGGGVQPDVHQAEAGTGRGQGEGLLLSNAGLISPAQPAPAGADEGQEPPLIHAPAAPGAEESKPDTAPAAAEGKRRRGRPPGSLNRKTIARMEAARNPQGNLMLQVGQRLQIQASVMDAAQALQRPEILAAAAANLGLVASWPSTKREGGTPSAASALPANSNGAAQLGGVHAAISATPLALVVGQPYTPVSVGEATGRPGGEGVQQAEPRAVMVGGPSAAGHAPVQQQGPAATASQSARGLVDLVSVIAGQRAAAAGLSQPSMLRTAMACGGTLPYAGSTAEGQAEPPPKRRRGRPSGSKNKKTLAAQQWAANGAALTAPHSQAQRGSAQHATPGAAAGSALATGSALPAQGPPSNDPQLSPTMQRAELACASTAPALARSDRQAASMQQHAHAPAMAQAAALLLTGAAGVQPGQAGTGYGAILAAQMGNGATMGAAASLPAAGSGVLPGVSPAKRGRPKGSKDSKPRKSRAPKPAMFQAHTVVPLNGQAVAGDSSAHGAITTTTTAQQSLAA